MALWEPNETKMSRREQERASLEVNGWKSFQNGDTDRSGIRSIAWLDVGSPPVDETANNKAADAAKDKNRNVFVCDNRIGKADEQAKQQSDKPTRPAR